MGQRRYRQGRHSGHLVLPNTIPSPGDKWGVRSVIVTSALVVLAATGCGGPIPDPAALDALAPETVTTEPTVAATTVPTTRVPAATARVRVSATAVPVPKVTAAPPTKATAVVRAAPTPRPSQPASVQGPDPVVWLSALCGGFNEGFTAAPAIGDQLTLQGVKDESLHFLDTEQQAFTNTAHKLQQLGAPGVTGGTQVQDAVVEFLTNQATAFGDSRAKLAVLDVNDPDFVQKANQLLDVGRDMAATQPPEVSDNHELSPEFLAVPECAKLAATMGHP
jgi:hypothetical protein